MDKVHSDTSKSRRFFEKLKPFVESVERYGKAMDVFVNTYPIIMCPLWGSFRVVLLVNFILGHLGNVGC